MLIQGADPCNGFQVMHSSTHKHSPVDVTHVAVKLPALTLQQGKKEGRCQEAVTLACTDRRGLSVSEHQALSACGLAAMGPAASM